MHYHGLRWIIKDCCTLQWITMDYHGLPWIMKCSQSPESLTTPKGMAQVWRIPEPPAVMYYHGLWIVADGCERSGPIEDYNAAQWITTNCAKPLTTPRRYGADMAHTVASIGQVLSWHMGCRR